APPQPRSESAFRSEPRGSAPGPYEGRRPLPDEQPPGRPGQDPGFEAAHAAPAEATPPPPEPDAPPVTGHGGEGEQPPAKSGGAGKAGGLLRSCATMAAGTMVARLTGFIRSAMVVAAIGAAVLGDTYQLAITLPTMLYILAGGGRLNS